MSVNRDSLFVDSDHGLTIAAHLAPGDGSQAQLCLAGEIDLASLAVLSRTIDWLTAAAPSILWVDLAKLTFASSTLANFILQVRQTLPVGAEIVLCRARPATGWVLQVTELATIATFCDDFPLPLAELI